MDEEKPINTMALEDEARSSDTGESWQPLEKSPSFRVGVGARIRSPERPAFFIEVIVDPCPGPDVDLSMMEKNLSVLKELESRGYTLRCEDDGSIVSEVLLHLDGVEGEVDWITEFLDMRYPTPH